MNYKKNITSLLKKSFAVGMLLLEISLLSILPFQIVDHPGESAISFSEIPVAHAQGLTCDGLVDPKQLDKYIITIIEERIAPQGKKGDITGDTEGVISCFRETDCQITNDLDPGSTTWKTRSTCEQVKYTSSCKSATQADPNKPEKQLSTVICQPVQILYAQSGANVLYTYISLIYRWTAGTAGIVTVLYLVIGGIGIATAQGDSGRLEKAKERIVNSIAGLVLLFLSALILYTINPNFFVLS